MPDISGVIQGWYRWKALALRFNESVEIPRPNPTVREIYYYFREVMHI